MFDPEAGQGAADLGQPPTIGGAARGRRVHGPVRAVGVQRQRQPIAVQHGAQGGHHRRHTLAADPQLGIQQLLGGVVDCGDQLEEPRASRRCSMGRGDASPRPGVDFGHGTIAEPQLLARGGKRSACSVEVFNLTPLRAHRRPSVCRSQLDSSTGVPLRTLDLESRRNMKER